MGFGKLSEEIFNRIPDNSDQANFLLANPDIAVRRNISL